MMSYSSVSSFVKCICTFKQRVLLPYNSKIIRKRKRKKINFTTKATNAKFVISQLPLKC